MDYVQFSCPHQSLSLLLFSFPLPPFFFFLHMFNLFTLHPPPLLPSESICLNQAVPFSPRGIPPHRQVGESILHRRGWVFTGWGEWRWGRDVCMHSEAWFNPTTAEEQRNTAECKHTHRHTHTHTSFYGPCCQRQVDTIKESSERGEISEEFHYPESSLAEDQLCCFGCCKIDESGWQ